MKGLRRLSPTILVGVGMVLLFSVTTHTPMVGQVTGDSGGGGMSREEGEGERGG